MQKTLLKNLYKTSGKKMAYFCVPADFRKETLEKLAKLNRKYEDSKIEEVYGNLPQTPYGSGRSSVSIVSVGLTQLKKYVKECRINGINFNYTFNASSLSNREFNNIEKKKIILFLKKLHSIGVRRFTVSLPSIVSLISNNFKDVDVVLSVVNNIKETYQLNEFLDAGKISRVYVAEDMNRRANKLKDLVKKAKVPLATIVNTFCLFECAYRYHHYNFMAFRDSNDRINVMEYYGARCGQIKTQNAREIVKMPWIRPNDIEKYLEMGIHWFKIAGREMIKYGADIPSAVEAYMSRSYSGDLIDLFFNFSFINYNKIFTLDSKSLDQYFNYILNKKTDCSRNLCEKCQMCEKYSKYVNIDKGEIKALPKFKSLK